MEIRDPAMPDRPLREPRPAAAPPPVESVSFRVDPRFTAVKVGGFVVFALAALAFHDDPAKVAFTAVAALVAGGYALRDVVAPVRLAASRDGVTVVRGYAGHHDLPWGEIERVRLDERRRLGTRSAAVEIDTGDHLYLLSQYDLGTDPADAVEALDRLRTSAPPSATG
jgi:Bacterial PH domain